MNEYLVLNARNNEIKSFLDKHSYFQLLYLYSQWRFKIEFRAAMTFPLKCILILKHKFILPFQKRRMKLKPKHIKYGWSCFAKCAYVILKYNAKNVCFLYPVSSYLIRGICQKKSKLALLLLLLFAKKKRLAFLKGK